MLSGRILRRAFDARENISLSVVEIEPLAIVTSLIFYSDMIKLYSIDVMFAGSYRKIPILHILPDPSKRVCVLRHERLHRPRVQRLGVRQCGQRLYTMFLFCY